MKTKLVVLEGIDGSGKTTVAETVTCKLLIQAAPIKAVKLPSYDKQTLNLLYRQDVTDYARAMFFALDHYNSYLKWREHYNNGGIVLCDRYVWSNIAYSNVDADWLYDLEFNRLGLPVPDLTIYLDMPPSYAQILRAKRVPDAVEQNAELIERAYNRYATLVKTSNLMPVKCICNNAIRSIGSIVNDVLNAIQTLRGAC